MNNTIKMLGLVCLVSLGIGNCVAMEQNQELKKYDAALDGYDKAWADVPRRYAPTEIAKFPHAAYWSSQIVYLTEEEKNKIDDAEEKLIMARVRLDGKGRNLSDDEMKISYNEKLDKYRGNK